MTIAEFAVPMVPRAKFKPTPAMSIYHQNNVNFQSPYFYIIEHVTSQTSKRYYAGYKGSKPDSRNLMQLDGYHTSSSADIIPIIKLEGLGAFIVRKIRHFATSREALSYEVKFLKKIKVGKNSQWYNRFAGGEKFISTAGRKSKPLSLKHKKLYLIGVLAEHNR